MVTYILFYGKVNPIKTLKRESGRAYICWIYIHLLNYSVNTKRLFIYQGYRKYIKCVGVIAHACILHIFIELPLQMASQSLFYLNEEHTSSAGVQFPARTRDYSLLHSVQTGSWTHPTSSPKCTEVFICRGKAVGA
jgi:hypothetical protein